MLASFVAPLSALMIIFAGVGMMNTLVALRLEEMGASNTMISIATSIFFVGLTLGSFRIDRFVTRVGHIRSYAVFASIIAITSLLCGMFLSPYLWLVFRFIAGIGIAGLFIVVESWLLALGRKDNRATILAIYMICLYFAISIGQSLLNIWDIETIYPFCLATILASLSVIPLSMTKSKTPVLEEASALTIFKLYKISPAAVVGSFVSGVLASVTHYLLPLALDKSGHSVKMISLIMAITIIGGVVFQYPIGRLGDKIDKRKVLFGLGFSLTIVSGLAIWFQSTFPTLFFATIFVFGGLAFALYTIGISYGCDVTDEKDVVAAVGGLVLVYGLGCIIGPLFIPGFMYLFDGSGFFVFCGIVTALLTIFILGCIRSIDGPPVEEQGDVKMHTQTSPVINEMSEQSKDP
jgi:MFS family permease